MFYSNLDKLYKKCKKCNKKGKVDGICREIVVFYTKIRNNEQVLKPFWEIEKCFGINCLKYNKCKKFNLNKIIKDYDLYTFTPQKEKIE